MAESQLQLESLGVQNLVSSNDKSIEQKRKMRFIIIGVTLVIIVIVVVLIAILLSSSEEEKSVPEYEFGLSMEELIRRTQPGYLVTFSLLTPESPEYLALAEGDKEALKHLVKSGSYLENIHLRIDSIHNLPFKKFLEEEIKKNNRQANLTKILFDAQKGINAIDSLSTQIRLAKGIEEYPGKGFYPEDLTTEEFHKIITKMLNDGKVDEVKTILNQRSMVFREDDQLKGIDYVEFFKDDFNKMADELDEAAKLSTNQEFNDYLKLQAQAFREPDNVLDAYADIQWATLQDTPLEYTITRENYDDMLTKTIAENKELSKLLADKNITVYPKDYIGCRVGIVNKEGTDVIIGYKQYLPLIAENMPYKDEYDFDNSTDSKQTMVDVDLVMLAGDVGAYRGGITLAENLPNDDKLSLKMGGGRRNVYHRQIRFDSNPEGTKKKLEAILDPEQHQYYKAEADHWFTIGHENSHTLGPSKQENLGKYTSIIEENKADMGGIAFVNLLKDEGFYTEEQAKEISVTAVVDFFLKSKPPLTEAHRVRSVMQNYYFFQKGAYEMTADGKIHINIEKVPQVAYEMLTEVIRLQLDDKFDDAEAYLTKYFIWTDEMESIAQKLQKISNKLNGRLETKLADYFLANK